MLKAFINRVWYALMGEAFYDPVDDIGPERTCKAPEVLDPLAEQWQKGGYDIRWLFSTILNTDAYQRRVRSTANAAGKTPFASSCPSRLRADQVFDALVQALAIPLDAEGKLMPGPGQGNGAPEKRRPGLPMSFPNNWVLKASPTPNDWPANPSARSRRRPRRRGWPHRCQRKAGDRSCEPEVCAYPLRPPLHGGPLGCQ